MTIALVLSLVVVVVLVIAVVLAVRRLLDALRVLRGALDGTRRRMQPMVDELAESSQVTDLEMAQLRSSVAQLQAGVRPSQDPPIRDA